MNDLFKIETALQLVDTYKLTLIGLASVTSLLLLVKRYFNGAYYYDKVTRLDGKTAIVTGANTGKNIILLFILLKNCFIDKFK